VDEIVDPVEVAHRARDEREHAPLVQPDERGKGPAIAPAGVRDERVLDGRCRPPWLCSLLFGHASSGATRTRVARAEP
jgi:hypothetical protein